MVSAFVMAGLVPAIHVFLSEWMKAWMPGDSGVLVVTRVLSTTTKRTRGRGCSGGPAFPTPSKGGRFLNASGASRREGAIVCRTNRVIARSEATKQSILSLRGKMDCVVARAPRNDVERLFEN